MWNWQGKHGKFWTGDDIRICIWCNTSIVPGPQKTPCWHWDLNIHSTGYGYMKIKDEVYMHRNSYLAFKGPIPEGKVIMHLCHNKWCVNPRHLEVGDHIENVRMYHAMAKWRRM